MKKAIVLQPRWSTRPKLFKLLIVMKLTAILLLVVSMHAYAIGNTQEAVSLSAKNIELKKLFTLIQKKTSYRFLYEDLQIPRNARVNIEVENASIQSVMDVVLRNTSLTYRLLNENLIVLSNGSIPKAPKLIGGKILDENGQPLSGVSIKLKGSETGVSTSESGEFSIDAPESATLVVSYVGYLTQEIDVKSNSQVSISLVPADKNMQEVVVVGYGTQKRSNLTGAVDAVTGKQLENRPLMNLGTGLQGLIPNLNITVPNGRATTAPGFNIRGLTSINGGDPLVLVDNIPFTTDEVSRLNPNDVESVTVLKDASSAAIYGARAAFGVVLITTKSAKGNKLNVAVNSSVAMRTIGKRPEIVTDPSIIMKYKHDAAAPLYDLYTDAQRAYAAQRSQNPGLPTTILDPDDPTYWAYYGSTDWIGEGYRSSAPTYNTNLSISKKSDKLAYYLSGEYYRQDGLLRYGNDIYKRYNVRAKTDVDVTKWLQISNNTMFTNTNYDAPVFMDELYFWNVNRTSPLDVPRNPDGSWTSEGANLLGRMKDGGRGKTNLTDIQTSFSFKATVIKDLWDIKGDATYRRGSSLKRESDFGIPFKTGPEVPVQYTTSTPYVLNTNTATRYNVYNLYTDVHKRFGDHFVQGLVGYNQEYRYENLSGAGAINPVSNSIPSLGLAGTPTSPFEYITKWAVQGLFYRLNYSFKNKYLVEFNGRYDGTSRFPKDDRWGFFPSASAGWVISEEKFFEPIKEAARISNFKIRGSYGALGNQSVAAFGYLPLLPYGPINQLIGDQVPIGITAPGAVSNSLTWEKVSTVNFGTDISFLNNRLEFNFDKYTRYTKDMLVKSKTLPAVFGTTEPKENAADLKTKGWELRASWRDNAKVGGSPLSYSISVAIADNKSYITKYDNPTRSLDDYYVGQRIGEIWGLEIEGFFQNQQELDEHADQTPVGTDDQGFEYFVGDIKFKDRNKDGVIDFGERTVDKPGDRYKIGNSTPQLPYSVDMSAGWKGFDVRVFIQGIGKRDWYAGASNIYFWGIYAQPWTNVTKQNLDHWSPENPNGYFPATRAYIAEDNMSEITIPNKRYLQDASYMRVKNVTLGYTLPRSILSRWKLDKIRIYAAAENIFEISHMKVRLDPEVGLASEPEQRAGTIYPFQRTYSFGLNVNF